MALRLVAASKTDSGLEREQNEDLCYAKVGESGYAASGLFIVADGMGGYRAGEVASRLAIDTIRDALLPMLGAASAQPTIRLNKRKRGRGLPGQSFARGQAAGGQAEGADAAEPGPAEAATGDEAAVDAKATQRLEESIAVEHYGDQLRDAVEHSSEAIVRYGRDHTEAHGLGSTVTAALVVNGRAYIANVGDSRTYLLRGGALQRITRDHSLVERLVEAGQIEPDEVYDHPNRNLIYRSLGADRAEVEVDIFTEQLRAGDTLLLCSDGLWEMVRDDELAGILTAGPDLAAACNRLIERANENGGVDNITAVVARCEEVAEG